MSAPNYPGPKNLNGALTSFRLERGSDARFYREGLRPDSEYRDLGLSAATGGKLGVKHIRAIGPFEQPTGEVELRAGDSLSQPAGVPHNVIARSEDFEVLELNVPAEYGTFEV
jgi:hypothetical protein